MAHYAKVINNIVEAVIVADQEWIDQNPVDGGVWIQTSYNTHGGVYYDNATGLPALDQTKALRKNFAVVGGAYDPENDAFIPLKDFPSWVLDPVKFTWEPPIPQPAVSLNNHWQWDEEQGDWVKPPAAPDVV